MPLKAVEERKGAVEDREEREAGQTRSRRRGSNVSPYRGKLPSGKSRIRLFEKMDVKE